MSMNKEQLAQVQKTTERFTAQGGELASYATRVRNKQQEPTPDTPERIAKRIARLTTQHAARPAERAPVNRMSVATEVVRAASAPSVALGLERIIGTSDLMSVTYLERGLRAARTVGRISIRTKKGGPVVGYGTGSLVSPALLLTNNHVFSSAAEARHSLIEFEYQERLDGTLGSSAFFALDPDAFFVTDAALDYTLVAVSDPEGKLKAYGFNRLVEAEGKVNKGEFLSIVQHPRGELKQVALRENRLIEVLDQFLIYQTDTCPGSSGSPVFNDEWEIVALHHSGFPRKDAQGNWLTKDGRVYQDGMDDSQIDWIANEGARVSRIIAHLKAAAVQASWRKLRDACFEMETATGPSRPPNQVPSPHATPSTPTSFSATPCISADGTATWTIPIQVSVRMGTGSGGGDSVAVDGDVASTSTTASDVGTNGAGTNGRGNGALHVAEDPALSSADLKEALADLEAARTRRYYDRTKDHKLRDAFYEGLNLPADKGQAYATLSTLLERKHKTKPAYRPGKEVYPWIDLRPGGKLQSVYSGKEYDPETFIREDFAKEERLNALEARLRSEASVDNPAWLERAIAALEAAMPYNCEHVVPQSWFAKKEPMRGDLHHLFACESGCNSFRGNIPYFDFSEDEEVVRQMCGRREAGKFEPVSGKGAVARATLYFLVRYPKEINNREGEYTEDRLKVLLSWHEQDAVSEYERHRNWAICERQGNRNPFIDFPEWAVKVDFKKGLGKRALETSSVPVHEVDLMPSRPA